MGDALVQEIKRRTSSTAVRTRWNDYCYKHPTKEGCNRGTDPWRHEPAFVQAFLDLEEQQLLAASASGMSQGRLLEFFGPQASLLSNQRASQLLIPYDPVLNE